MEIEEPLINELLLVGAALGSTEAFTAEDGSLVERFIRGENCLEWLQDLQRALRRDDEATRAVAIRLGNWRVVETKLLPLLLECRDDMELVVTLAKLFVMLTMPLGPTTRKWARFQVDARDAAEMGGSEAAKRRAAARAQVQHLLNMKRAFVQVAGGEAIAALVGAMEEPLARGARRTEADTLVIELVLTLFRNLLCIEDVCRGLAAAGGEEGPPGGVGDGVDDRHLHQELLVLLEREYVLDVVLCLCQGVQARENQPWNLLLMEIVFHLLRGHDAADVAAAGPPPPREGDENTDPAATGATTAPGLPLTTPAPPKSRAGAGGGNALSALLQQERLARAAVAQRVASRHSRFGGGLLLAGFDGKATRLVTNPFKDALASLPQARRKRTRRGAAVFASDGLTGAAGGGGAHELEAGLLLLPKGAPDPLTLRARQGLHGFCRQLVEGGGYEPFMKSLKNEFRRDSSRLEPGDRIVFFRIVGFVLAFHR
jgi:timeless